MIFEVEVLKVFLLVLVRFSGLIVAAPVLGSANFPARAKIGLAILGAMVIVPTLPALVEPLPDEAVHFTLIATGELIIGLMMGFVMTLVFAAIQVAGEIMDMQTGFSLMNVFNPALETQVPIFGFMFFIIAALYLFVLDGHHLMIQALVSSYIKIPIGGFVLRPALLREVSTWGSAMFYDGLLVAAPVAGAMLLAYTTLGILSRLIPQIHLFVVGFPLTIALGLLVAALSMQVYVGMLDGMFSRMFKDVSNLIRGMS
ncbi:MAG: flagellar biosynthetic protein FliR [Candidatus Hydrogenedentes bacterium]|nr:flagellar biosynthetic protein FliR [Candidatus Hydrogenedentota bacterium]